MKKFILFWKKDIINKLIVITSMMLVAGALAFIFMLVNMPDGKSLRDAVSEIIPFPPTADPDSITTTTPSVTDTALPFNVVTTPVAGDFEVQPTLPPELLIPTFTPEQFTATPLASATPVAAILNSDCIPKNTSQIGKVLSVVDGNTINVMIDGLVYVVRYIGVAVPEDTITSDKARLENATLVFGKEITLIPDQSNKDVRGRLLRYVMVGNTFVNLKLIQQGLGSALDTPPDSACAQTFMQAGQSVIVSTPSDILPVETPTP